MSFLHKHRASCPALGIAALCQAPGISAHARTSFSDTVTSVVFGDRLFANDSLLMGV